MRKSIRKSLRNCPNCCQRVSKAKCKKPAKLQTAVSICQFLCPGMTLYLPKHESRIRTYNSFEIDFTQLNSGFDWDQIIGSYSVDWSHIRRASRMTRGHDSKFYPLHAFSQHGSGLDDVAVSICELAFLCVYGCTYIYIYMHNIHSVVCM